MKTTVDNHGVLATEGASWRSSTPTGLALTALMICAAYYIGAVVSLALRFPSSPDTIFWLPNAILLAALLLLPPKKWLLLLLAAFPAHVVSQLQYDLPIWPILYLYLHNIVLALLAAVCVRRFAGPRFSFTGLRQTCIFVIIVVISPALMAPTLAALDVVTGLGGDFRHLWQVSYLSNILAFLTLVPAIVIGFNSMGEFIFAFSRRRIVEACLLTAGLLFACKVTFGLHVTMPGTLPALFLVPLPFLLWSALRFGPEGSSAAALVTTLITVWYAVRGYGPFTKGLPAENVLSIQLFLAMLSVSLMSLAALTKDKRTAEESLRESEKRYRALVEASSQLVWRADAQGEPLAENLPWKELTGQSDDELQGNGWLDAIHPADRERALQGWLRAVQERKAYENEFRVRVHDGNYRCYQVRGVPIFAEDGTLIEWVGSNADITERRRLEEELRRRERQFSTLVENSPDIIFRLDLDLRFSYISPNVVRTMGLKPRQILGKALSDSTHPEFDYVQYGAKCREALMTGAPVLREGSLSGRYYRTRFIPEFAPDGSVESLLGITEDITERKRAEEALRESEARSRAILKALPDMMFLQTRDGVYIDYHAKDLSELLIPPEQFLGKNMRDVLPRDLAENMARCFEEAWSRDEPTRLEYSLPIHGETRHYEARTVRTDNNALLSIVRNITDRRRAEESLRQLTGRLLRVQDEERRQIARDLHDVTAQNLVAMVGNFAYLRNMNAGLNERTLGVVSESIALGEQVLQEIRKLSYVLHPPLLDQSGLASALQWFADGFSKRSGIQITLTLEDFGRLTNDAENALFRVVQECLNNVSKHSGSRTASIKLTREAERVVLQVEDEGYGIPGYIAEQSNELVTLGVGIPGMRERLRQFGGDLLIHSGPSGTVVRAIVPIEDGGAQ
ncbi:MAG: PAS domain S-box protein [Acidobacteria bacterium]|nr:PAS domain S-box protein [Acidobacteriota bacterium]